MHIAVEELGPSLYSYSSSWTMANPETLASGDVVNIPISSVTPTATSDAGRRLPLSGAFNAGAESDEQALETHEVIELQTFSDRKVWIEEKIKARKSHSPIMHLNRIRI